MDVSLAFRQAVVSLLPAVPVGSPPVVINADKSISMHFEWLVACKPQVVKTKFPSEPNRREREEIENITG